LLNRRAALSSTDAVHKIASHKCTSLAQNLLFDAFPFSFLGTAVRVAVLSCYIFGFKNRHQLFVEIRGPCFNLLSPCLFLKPYIKAVMAVNTRPLSVCSNVPTMPEVIWASSVFMYLADWEPFSSPMYDYYKIRFVKTSVKSRLKNNTYAYY
jgi:hypothetical protein